MRNKLQINK